MDMGSNRSRVDKRQVGPSQSQRGSQEQRQQQGQRRQRRRVTQTATNHVLLCIYVCILRSYRKESPELSLGATRMLCTYNIQGMISFHVGTGALTATQLSLDLTLQRTRTRQKHRPAPAPPPVNAAHNARIKKVTKTPNFMRSLRGWRPKARSRCTPKRHKSNGRVDVGSVFSVRSEPRKAFLVLVYRVTAEVTTPPPTRGGVRSPLVAKKGRGQTQHNNVAQQFSAQVPQPQRQKTKKNSAARLESNAVAPCRPAACPKIPGKSARRAVHSSVQLLELRDRPRQ